MNDAKSTITLLTCCCIVLTISPSASADFVGVTTVIKDDPDTEFLCTQGNGKFVPGPVMVCKAFAVFDNPDDALLSVGNADLQVYDGENPDVFFQHPFNPGVIAPSCFFVDFIFPDLICDTFITIAYECGPDPAGTDQSAPDGDFDAVEFGFNGHIVGGWFNASDLNGQGEAGTWPDLRVLFLQSAVGLAHTMSGDIDLFWWVDLQGETYAELDVPIECAATCGSCPTDSDGDGDTDAADLAVLLGNWGPVDAGECLDTDSSGSIGAFDLAVLLGASGLGCQQRLGDVADDALPVPSPCEAHRGDEDGGQSESGGAAHAHIVASQAHYRKWIATGFA